MLITKASEYALLALLTIAQDEALKDSKKLSNELLISKSFLAKVLQNLVKGGILKSYKGVNGGFALAKDPSKISINEIVKICEKKTSLVCECATSPNCCAQNKAQECKIWPFFNRFQIQVDGFLNSITLQDLLKG